MRFAMYMGVVAVLAGSLAGDGRPALAQPEIPCAPLLRALRDDAGALVVAGEGIAGKQLAVYGTDRRYVAPPELPASTISMPWGRTTRELPAVRVAPTLGSTYAAVAIEAPGCVATHAVVASAGPRDGDLFASAVPSVRVFATEALAPLTCAEPYRNPGALRVTSPEIPAQAARDRITGLVHLRLALDAEGEIRSATVVTSPSEILSSAALRAVRQGRFAPQVFRCVAVPSFYDFFVEFTNQ